VKTARQNIYDVAAFGISDTELEILRRIFVVSEDRPISYRLQQAESRRRHTRIMLLDRKDNTEVARWADAHKNLRHQPATIYLTQNEPGDNTFCLRRPLITTRVLAVLDRAVSAPAALDTQTASTPTVFEENSTCIVPRQYRALVVDVNLPVRTAIAAALKKVRVGATFAESGEQALAVLDQSDFDIVFLDAALPGVDGYDVCKRIKVDPEKSHIPVVLLTANSSAVDRTKGKIAGCDAYLVKPVSKDDFYQTVRKNVFDKAARTQDQ